MYLLQSGNMPENWFPVKTRQKKSGNTKMPDSQIIGSSQIINMHFQASLTSSAKRKFET